MYSKKFNFTMDNYLLNLFKPWKLIALAIGIGILIVGSVYEDLPDWDIGISIIMAGLTFLTAPYVCLVIRNASFCHLPLAMFLAWFSIDGSYWLYNSLMGNIMVRDANFYCSAPLYFICGLLWSLDWNENDI